MYTRPAGNATNFTTVFPGSLGYIRPAYNSVVLQFAGAYTQPANTAVVLRFGGKVEYTRPPGNATNFIWVFVGLRVVWFVVNC